MATLSPRFLLVYSTALTLVSAGVIYATLQPNRSGKLRVDELQVQRINVVEPDGTLRLVLSNHARLPGIYHFGKEAPYPRPQAGLIFLNDEGSENGGLIFGGAKNAKGEVVDSGGSLSFDRYGGNQEVQLIGVHDKEDRFAGLIVSDSPADANGHRRVWVGKDESETASVALMDAKGKKRLLLEVKADGTASLAFLDEKGVVTDRIAPKAGR
jgi:hypothetical protein